MSAEQENNAGTVPEIQNKAQTPPGVSAKNKQTLLMLLAGGAIVLVIALSNSSPSSTAKPKPSGSGSTSANPATPKAIQEYARQLDDDVRNLGQERARAEQMRADATRLTAGQQNPNQNPYQTTQTPSGVPPVARQVTPEEAARTERRKREEDSLRASNIALTFRNDVPGSPSGTQSARSSELADLRQMVESEKASLLATMQSSPSPALTASASKPEPAANAADTGKAAQPSDSVLEANATAKKRQDPELTRFVGKPFRLFEGTTIETVLTNRLNGSLSGPVNALVTTSVYSHDGQHILIPQGSRVLGEVQRVATTGQQRLAVIFHRLIMPDGYSLSLDQFKGLNQIGETGLTDKVNQHYLQIFGTSLALGAVAGIEQGRASYGYNTSGTDLYRQGVAQSLSSSATRILDRFLNVLPTITIREGHRIKVYLTGDLLIPVYENHRIPGDL